MAKNKGLSLLAVPVLAASSLGFATPVFADTGGDCVARITEDSCYSSIQAAIDAAEEGDTINLLINRTETPTVNEKKVAFDLHENTWTVDGRGLDVYASEIELKNGTLTTNDGFGVYLNYDSTFTLDPDAKITAPDGTAIRSDLVGGEGENTVNIYGTIEANLGIQLSVTSNLNIYPGAEISSDSNTGAGVLVNVRYKSGKPETSENASTVNIDGAKISGKNTAISTNGNIKEGNGPTINISTSTIEATDAENEPVAIYLAGLSKTTIDNSDVTGFDSAIEIRAGSLEIDGGTFTALSKTNPAQSKANGNGSTTAGAAIAIAQHTTKLPISVNIYGGKFIASTPLFESDPQGNKPENISIYVADGDFKSNGSMDVYSEDVKDFLEGGRYVHEPSTEYYDESVYDTYGISEDGLSYTLDKAGVEFDDSEENIYIKAGEYYEAEVAGQGVPIYKGAWDDSENREVAMLSSNRYSCDEDGENCVGDYAFEAKVAGKTTITLTFDGKTKKFNVFVYDVEAADEEDESAASQVLELVKELLGGGESAGIDEETAAQIINAIKQGKTIDVEVVPDALDEVTEEGAEDEIKAVIDDDTLVGYYDINVALSVDGKEIGKVTELGTAVEVSIELDEVVDGAKYYVVRYYDGEAERLDATLEGKTLSFESDKFSTYAVAYSTDDEDDDTPNTSLGITGIVAFTGAISMLGAVKAVKTIKE